MDLTAYDLILVDTSAGKDSLVMLDEVVLQAEAQGVRSRVVAVHCDLGRVEWPGTRELAAKQCALYGVPLHTVSRAQGNLLAQVEQRRRWPSPAVRYCTSDHKRDQVTPLITQLVTEWTLRTYGRRKVKGTVRVLNCLGLRAQESTKRAQEPVFRAADRGSSGVRQIDRWLPIHEWTEAQVWDRIRTKGLPYHYAYDLGMPRLSCVFCIYAPESALLIAGHHNRQLLDEYVDLERRIGHAFKYNSDTKQAEPLVQIQAKLEAGYVPQGKVDSDTWAQCGGGF